MTMPWWTTREEEESQRRGGFAQIELQIPIDWEEEEREKMKLDMEPEDPNDDDDDEEDEFVVCANCPWEGYTSELTVRWPDIPSLNERIEPGGTVPSGECPKCGALVYPLEEE